MSTPQTDWAASPVSLVIPCRAEYVALCRLVAGALGLRDSLDEEMVADLKVVVTEACNCFLAMAAAGEEGAPAGGAGAKRPAPTGTVAEDLSAPSCSLRMDFDSQPDAFVISLVYPGPPRLISWLEGCDPMSEAGLGLTILRALTDGIVELDTATEGLQAEGTVLRLTKLLRA
jgi:hypothetical protein